MKPLKSFSEVKLLLRYSFAHNNPLLVDVGGHHGSFSLPFACKGWQVIGFEPEPSNREAFEQNLAKYPNVFCSPRAVSNVSGDNVPFYVSTAHFGIHALKPFHPTHEESCKVETICLNDALIEINAEFVTLLKIDIEGADFLALKGFDIERYHPELVILEFMDDRSQPYYGYTHHDVVQYMQQYGYVAFVSEWAPIKEYGREGVKGEPHSWLQCVPYPLDHEPAWGNLIFVPEGDRQKFEECLQDYLRSNTFMKRAFSRVLKSVGIS